MSAVNNAEHPLQGTQFKIETIKLDNCIARCKLSLSQEETE